MAAGAHTAATQLANQQLVAILQEVRHLTAGQLVAGQLAVGQLAARLLAAASVGSAWAALVALAAAARVILYPWRNT
jgi:hypothetical protein